MKKNKKQRPFSWMNPKLEIRDTKKYGKGVFAKADLKKNETLFVIGGYILTLEDEDELVRTNNPTHDKPIEISDLFSIGPLKDSDMKLMPQHYVNHSCDPNSGFNGQIFLVAMKKIKKGQEVCFDYGMVMNSNTKSKSYFTMNCFCGSKKCRHIITEDDWKILELQKRYNGYFQWFLQRKIDKK